MLINNNHWILVNIHQHLNHIVEYMIKKTDDHNITQQHTTINKKIDRC